jgi:competence protein ComEA
MKRLLALLVLLQAVAAFAGVDVNSASAADLDGIKGIGPPLTRKILEERGKGAFKDWPDLMARVSGIKKAKAAALSREGLTVNGAGFP